MLFFYKYSVDKTVYFYYTNININVYIILQERWLFQPLFLIFCKKVGIGIEKV